MTIFWILVKYRLLYQVQWHLPLPSSCLYRELPAPPAFLLAQMGAPSLQQLSRSRVTLSSPSLHPFGHKRCWLSPKRHLDRGPPHPLPPGPVLASVPLRPHRPFCCSHFKAFMNTDGPQPSPRPRTSPHSCLRSNVSSRWGLTRHPHLKLLLTFPRCHQSIIHRFISLLFPYCSWLPRKFSHLLLLCIVHFPFLPFPFLQTRYTFREREAYVFASLVCSKCLELYQVYNRCTINIFH